MSKEAGRLWSAALGQLQLQVTRANYETWLRHTKGLTYEGGTLRVGVASDFAREWLSGRLRPLIRRTLTSIEGHAVDVEFAIAGAQEAPFPVPAIATATPEATPAPRARAGATGLVPRYTFETLVHGESNALAYTAARRVVEEPGTAYNPLYLYGDVGLGKTHLLHAIGNALSAHDLRVLYFPAERFANDYVRAILDHRFDAFREHYRTADVLLVDDVQFLSGKNGMQEEFYHTFNELYAVGRQIVLSADAPPAAMPQLDSRLRSRFEWGLLADIQQPGPDVRQAYVKLHAGRRQDDLSEEALDLLAARPYLNMRELEGTMNKVLATARARGIRPTPALIGELLAKLPREVAREPLTARAVLAATIQYYGLAMEDISGTMRRQQLVKPRHVAMYLLREDCHLPLAEIGRLMGGRDHTTVLHAVTKIGKATPSDVALIRQSYAAKIHRKNA